MPFPKTVLTEIFLLAARRLQIPMKQKSQNWWKGGGCIGLSHIVHPENNTGYQHEVPSDLQMTPLRILLYCKPLPLSCRKIGIFRVIQKSCPLKPSWCFLVTNQSDVPSQDASCPCQCHFVGMRAAWHRLPVGRGDGRETSSCFPSLISQQLGKKQKDW